MNKLVPVLALAGVGVGIAYFVNKSNSKSSSGCPNDGLAYRRDASGRCIYTPTPGDKYYPSRSQLEDIFTKLGKKGIDLKKILDQQDKFSIPK